MFKANLSLQKNGSTILCVLEGETKDIVDAFNSLFNWGAVGDLRRGDTGLEFTYADNKRATCWTTPEKLFRYFFIRHENLIQDEQSGGVPNENPLMDLAQRKEAFIRAKKTFASLKCSPFFNPTEQTPDEHGLGEIVAEKPDADAKDLFFAEVDKARE